MIVVILAAQAIVFLWWAYEAFRALFDLRARAEEETGQVFPGPLALIRMAGQWMRDPGTRRRRMRLLALTAVLFGSSLASAFAAPAPV